MSKVVTLKADKELYEEWGRLALQIKNLSALVQNDGETDLREIREWSDKSWTLKVKMEELTHKTLTLLLKDA